jgi:probable addiction module antidote protein
MARSRAYEETLNKVLADPEQAAEYLNAALDENDPAAFLMALKDVANVHGGMSWLAEETSLNRENMYRMFSEDGNPRINSLNAVLQALGLRLSITPEKTRRSAA